MRKTQALVQVAAALMSDPSERHWGYELSKLSGYVPASCTPSCNGCWIRAG